MIPSDDRSSRGYYINDGMGPDSPSTNYHIPIPQNAADTTLSSDRTSQQYATVDPNQRLADRLAQALDYSPTTTTSSSSSSENDVPSSSLRPNIAYGLEQKANNRRAMTG